MASSDVVTSGVGSLQAAAHRRVSRRYAAKDVAAASPIARPAGEAPVGSKPASNTTPRESHQEAAQDERAWPLAEDQAGPGRREDGVEARHEGGQGRAGEVDRVRQADLEQAAARGAPGARCGRPGRPACDDRGRPACADGRTREVDGDEGEAHQAAPAGHRQRREAPQGEPRAHPRGAPQERRPEREGDAGPLLRRAAHPPGRMGQARGCGPVEQPGRLRRRAPPGPAARPGRGGPSRTRRRTSALPAPPASTSTWRAAPMTLARKVTRARCGSTCVGAAMPMRQGRVGGEGRTAREARQDVPVGAHPEQQQVEDRDRRRR